MLTFNLSIPPATGAISAQPVRLCWECAEAYDPAVMVRVASGWLCPCCRPNPVAAAAQTAPPLSA